MRTTQAARYARWSVTSAALVAVMVAAAYGWQAWEARKAQATAPPPVPPAVQQRSAEFTFSKVVGNNTRFILRAAQATEFKEGGRALLEDVWITAFGGNGARSDQLHTRSCEYLPSSGTVTCPDEVLIDLYARPNSSQDADVQGPSDAELHGVHVVTSHLSFHRETGMATSNAPVRFRFPEGEGRAVGLAYDSQRGELRLLREVELVFRAGGQGNNSPLPAGDPMTISSQELIYRRDEGLIHLNGAARMHSGNQDLEAGRIELELDRTAQARRLVARDHPVFRDRGGASEISLAADELTAPLDGMGRPKQVLASGRVVLSALRGDGRHELTATSSTLDFLPGSQTPGRFSAKDDVTVRSTLPGGAMRRLRTSQLDVTFVPEGQADSRIERATAAAATMEWESSSRAASRQDAETMSVKGDLLDGSFDAAGQLRELRGSGGVEVRRQSLDDRLMTSASRELLAHIAPDGEWTTVDQSGEVRLQNAGGNARGDRVRFDRASGNVVLAGSAVLTDDSSQTRAQTMTFRQGSGQLTAEGDVSTTELGVPARGRGSGAKSEPAHISSSRMVADTSLGHAVYSGRARLWQGASIIQADTIDLDRSKGMLIATGNASAVFPQAGQVAGGSPPTGFWRAEASRLVYEESQHRAKLEGKAHARSPDGSMRADRMDVFLAPGTGKGAAAARGGGFGSSLGDQQVQSAQGFGSVLVESAGRTGTGERADYTAAEGKFVLSGGNPKLIDEFGNSTAGRQLTFYFSDDRIVVDSEEGTRTLTLHRVEK